MNNKKPGFWTVIGILFVCILIIGAIKDAYDKNKETQHESYLKLIPTTTISQLNKKPGIEYKVFYQNIEPNLIGMTLIVSPKTTKAQALSLGEYFRNKYSNKNYVSVAIFDNEWAAKNQMNMDIPSERKTEHFLVQVRINKNSGMDAVQWMKD
ncbi:MAG: hypothetical protein ABIH69_04805 [bacterium]